MMPDFRQDFFTYLFPNCYDYLLAKINFTFIKIRSTALLSLFVVFIMFA